jgi:hypothetical protein
VSVSSPVTGWDLEYRPRKLRRYAVIAAVVVLAIHIVFGALLTISDTGVRNIGVLDQLSIMLIGVVIAGVILLFTRPRIRVGAEGVSVRNLVTERLFEWDRVRGLSYPEKGSSAHLELPDDEYIPVLAVRASDGEQAVAAMDRFRDLDTSYRTR